MTISHNNIAAAQIDLETKKLIDQLLTYVDAGTLVGGLTATGAELNVLHGVTAGTAKASGGVVLDSALGISAFRETGRNLRKQAAPAAKTTSTTLTAAEVIAGLLTVNQGGGANSALQMIDGTALETALLVTFPGLANDDSFDFTIVNISTVAAETASLTTNTNITIVGDATIAAIAVGDESSATFRVRRTAANTYSVYRIS